MVNSVLFDRWATAAKEISQQLELRTKEVKRQEAKLAEAIQAREEAQVTIKHLSRSLVASEELKEKQENHSHCEGSKAIKVSACEPDALNLSPEPNELLFQLPRRHLILNHSRCLDDSPCTQDGSS